MTKGLPIPAKVIAAYTLSNLTPKYESTMAIISQTIRTTSGAEIDLLQLFGHLVDESRWLRYRDKSTEMAIPFTNNKGKSRLKYAYYYRIEYLEEKY